jgi:hypothetical protein
MHIPHWLSTPALIAAIGAIFVSLLPILLKVLTVWMHRRTSTTLQITLTDGNKGSIEAKSLDSENVRQIIDALAVKPKGKEGVADE